MAVASVQVKELCWAEGRLAVGYPYLIILSSKNKKEKDINEPLKKIEWQLCSDAMQDCGAL